MMFAEAFDLFREKSAVSVMARAMMENAFSGSHLDAIFAENRIRQTEGDLPFSQVVDVMSLAVLQIRPSVNSAYGAKEEEMGVSVRSLYSKLSGIEPCVSRAMVRETAANMSRIQDEMQEGAPHATQAGYRTKIVDGKHLNRTERRLKPLREINGAPLPGIALAVLDADRRLVSDVIPCEDGHAQERSLFGQVLETVEKGDLWIADRNFATVGFLHGIASRGAHFAIRRHANLPLEEVRRKKRVGETAAGTVYEQSAEIPSPHGPLPVRLITLKLKRATQHDDSEIVVVSNLPRKVSARRITKLYRDRWSIEKAFHQVAMSLHGEIDSLAYPKAALFGFCIALVGHNLLNVVKAAIATEHGKKADGLSSYYLANEISAAYHGMMIVLPAEFWEQNYADLDPAEMAQKLLDLAGQVKWNRFKKSTRGPKKPPPDVGDKTNRNHISTHRILHGVC